MNTILQIANAVAGALNLPAMHVWGAPLTWAEVLGFGTGLWCVWLVAQRRILNFPVGIANCLLLLFLFFQARLYADAGLQLVFIALGLRGWWLWSGSRSGDTLAISRLDARHLAGAVAGSLVVAGLLYVLLTWAKGSVPAVDALVTSLSLVAQGLLNRRKLEHWYFWIVVDLVSIPLYVYKELYLVALLYTVFLGLCLAGLRVWRREWAGELR